jgi:hypothetical protein
MMAMGYKRITKRINGSPVYGYECATVIKRAPTPHELAPVAPW